MTRKSLFFLSWMMMFFSMPTQAVDREKLMQKKKGIDESAPAQRLLENVKKDYLRRGIR